MNTSSDRQFARSDKLKKFHALCLLLFKGWECYAVVYALDVSTADIY